ncbi:MAG: hypothetical protein EPN79_10890 [Burkholderiaceae bacterium]|nr:MAG: hypothetical protein EPN79_10890 [Burkholderiaceae bacterium]TBR76809.1 MAG: hypothetical protein EPN64_06185 [Burkholderiaceae bacterium]
MKAAPSSALARSIGAKRMGLLAAAALVFPLTNAFAGFVDNRPAPAPTPAAAAQASANGKVAGSAGVASVVVAPVKAAAPAFAFTVTREDKTIRQTLVRWSHEAGWNDDPENWTVDFDLPVVSSANLGTNYKTAVRQLLASTELTSTPLQPCFYSNKVLRIVPRAQLCDRSTN